MSVATAFVVTPSGDPAKPGAAMTFPYDRALVRRFRRRFAAARWNDGGWWWVPGVTAAARLERWAAEELDDIDRHGDARGRDAYAFEPLVSRYLEAGDTLLVRTPFSQGVVRELRQVPWAAWDADAKAWAVPWRSFDELKRRWPVIEAEAARAEPGVRAERRAQTPRPDAMTLRRHADRRKFRYPVPGEDLPPAKAAVGTLFGVVLFEEFGEPLTASEAEPYDFAVARRFVWGSWRTPEFRELRRAATEPAADRSRGWWVASDAELDHTRDLLGRRIRRVSRSATTG